MKDADLYGGLVRLHILYHASRGPVFGLGIIEELARHGYRLSAGTLYPMLHAMEEKGYLKSSRRRAGGRIRRSYRITPPGRRAFAAAKDKVKELFGELFEEYFSSFPRRPPRFSFSEDTRGSPAPPPSTPRPRSAASRSARSRRRGPSARAR